MALKKLVRWGKKAQTITHYSKHFLAKSYVTNLSHFHQLDDGKELMTSEASPGLREGFHVRTWAFLSSFLCFPGSHIAAQGKTQYLVRSGMRQPHMWSWSPELVGGHKTALTYPQAITDGKSPGSPQWYFPITTGTTSCLCPRKDWWLGRYF